ncbi:MAG: hypothetical protein RSC24_03880 [Clostridium sp.]
MEITAKFNNGEEMMAFAKMLLGNNTKEEVEFTAKMSKSVEVINEEVKEVKEETPKVEAEVIGVNQEQGETKDAEIVVDDKQEDKPVVTKEMVRAIFTKLIKEGKQAKAKELTSKYGAAKLGEVKEEDYAAILKDAEELL